MSCGARPFTGTAYCFNCGGPTTPLSEICVKCGVKLTNIMTTSASSTKPAEVISPKSRLATTLLSFFLGAFGAHRFYIGKIVTAVIMLLLAIVGYATFWIFLIGYMFLIPLWIWNLVDFIMTVSGLMKDNEGRIIQNW
jgi:TM2 domain-containing membrane protein YozV